MKKKIMIMPMIFLLVLSFASAVALQTFLDSTPTKASLNCGFSHWEKILDGDNKTIQILAKGKCDNWIFNESSTTLFKQDYWITYNIGSNEIKSLKICVNDYNKSFCKQNLLNQINNYGKRKADNHVEKMESLQKELSQEYTMDSLFTDISQETINYE